MCGRFTITVQPNAVTQALNGVTMPDQYHPRYNVAPTQQVAVVTSAENRQAEWMRWGLIPFWAKDPSIASRLINARSETVMEKPAFKNAFQKRRCLLVADGFYEWQKGGPRGRSQPFYFQREDGQPFAFAGLWESWKSPEGEDVRTCTLITCEANDCVAPVHERMPVMLTGDRLWDWLRLDEPFQLQALLRPYEGPMKRHPVAPLVNRPELDQPDLVLPLAA